jgi:protein-tyrosine phosphatase
VPEVLLVCRANLCRSPAAELMLRAALGPTSPVGVGSAGLRAVPDSTVPAEFVRQLASRGLDVRSHRPRRVDAALVGAADLVVVMTRSQRSMVVTAVPAAVRRTVLLPEAADRVRVDDAGRLVVVPGSRPVEDVVDPYGFDPGGVAASLDRIGAEVQRLADALRGVPG